MRVGRHRLGLLERPNYVQQRMCRKARRVPEEHRGEEYKERSVRCR